MRRAVLSLATCVISLLGVVAAASSCNGATTLGNTPYSSDGAPSNVGNGNDGGGADDGGGAGDDDSSRPSDDGGGCNYTDNDSYCKCMGWNCGGFTVTDAKGTNQIVYCGQCSNTAYCKPDPVEGPGVGQCGGTNPLTYAFQKEKIDMLVSMGENDNTTVDYGFASNILDGRGYTIGKVGFCTGTGDFIVVAACYNILEPGNILSKYWGHRDSAGKAVNGLIYYNDVYLSTGQNQGDTKLIDSLGPFVSDIQKAAAEGPPAGSKLTKGAFETCQDSMADAFYLAAAAQHADDRGLRGAMTVGFLYDTELNFGDQDDPGTDDAGGTAGALTVMARADKDYGSGLPTDFTGKPWEESRWLGYLIKERTIVMAGNSVWKTDIDQDATWEGARRSHTGASNSAETGTSLDLDYDLTSEYKSGSAVSGTPCWTGLPSVLDSQSSIYIVSTDKAASATNEALWSATGTLSTGDYAACPSNPTP